MAKVTPVVAKVTPNGGVTLAAHYFDHKIFKFYYLDSLKSFFKRRNRGLHSDAIYFDVHADCAL